MPIYIFVSESWHRFCVVSGRTQVSLCFRLCNVISTGLVTLFAGTLRPVPVQPRVCPSTWCFTSGIGRNLLWPEEISIGLHGWCCRMLRKWIAWAIQDLSEGQWWPTVTAAKELDQLRSPLCYYCLKAHVKGSLWLNKSSSALVCLIFTHLGP